MRLFYIIILPLIVSLAISSESGLLKMNSFDLEAVLLEDQNRQPGTPERYAYNFNVDINFFNAAYPEVLDNGDTIWRLRLQSDDAIGMKVYFNQFFLAENSSLMIYSQQNDMIEGPFTSDNNHDDMEFSHALIKGSILTLEYLEPANLTESSLLNISNVYHAYKDILGFYESDGNRNCGVNTACDNGDYEDQINSVIFLDMNGYICSAALVNNTSFDLTPYVLTAYHCVDPETPGEHNYFTFYFKHQASSCSGSSGSYSYSRTGSTLRSSYYYSDFALLEMDYTPAASFNGYYAGWDRSSTSPQVSAGIHHPGGQAKKINYDNNDTASSDGWYSTNTHWRLSWDEGGTEGGSSGSPLFDENKLIVGQLHGGSGECGSGTDYYGKMSTSCTGGGSNTTRLSDWLDPIGAGQTSISGTYNGENGSAPAEVTLLSPNGGETFESGGTHTVTWDDNFDDNVSLKLYKGGVFASTIVSSTQSDGSYSWNIPTDIEERDDYKIKITNVNQSTVYDYTDFYFAIESAGSVSINITDVSLNGSEGSATIYMDNDTPVAGYQFVFSDSPDYINITGVEDLTNSGFSVSSNADGQVIAFSFTGGTIDPGSRPLLLINFEILTSDTVSLCLSNPVFSNPSASLIPVNLGECIDIELTQVQLGDINFDGIINVLDAVILVNAVLNSTPLEDLELQAADINSDEILNVLDVVQLVNIILNP